MQDLKVIGVESGALLVATDAGSEFRLPVTLSLQSQLRAADPSHSPAKHRVAPREIQASIRAGRSAEQVAADCGIDVDDVRRFEGPVLAERDFVLESARRVPVSIAGEGGAASEASTFGAVIDLRLDGAEATDRTWGSFKDPGAGWIVRVTYTTAEVEREALWRFDPKKQGLAPHGGDAQTLSRQDGGSTSLVPRLRAVGDSSRSGGAVPNESGRFDSGAFEVEPELGDDDTLSSEEPELVSSFDRSRSAASVAAMNRAPEVAPAHNQTADLLEALRRRRGEREAARFDDDDSRSAHPSSNSMRVIDVPLTDFDEAERVEPPRATKPLATHPTASRPPLGGSRQSVPEIGRPGDPSEQRREGTHEPEHAAGQNSGHEPSRPSAPEVPRRDAGRREPTAARPSRARKGRASMPSWDEIVFGARPDDDPA